MSESTILTILTIRTILTPKYAHIYKVPGHLEFLHAHHDPQISQWALMLDTKAVVTLVTLVTIVKTYKYVDRLESVLSPILAPSVNLTDFLVVEGSRRCGASHILTVY